MKKHQIEILRSDRRTIGIEVRPEGILVRAPRKASKRQIRQVLDRHQRWIENTQARILRQRQEATLAGALSEEDIRRLKEQAKEHIPPRVAHYAPLVGRAPGRITIRCQKTRWGSCSSKGNLNFNCLLMLTPPEVIDSVVVHELCHLKEMNHSPRFYEEVLRIFPQYRRWNQWLREHGGSILQRVR